jgi:hypothetical protein
MTIVVLIAAIALAVLVATVVWGAVSDRADRSGPRRPTVWDDVGPHPSEGDVITKGPKATPLPPTSTKPPG